MFIQLTVHETLGGTERRAVKVDRIQEVRRGTGHGHPKSQFNSEVDIVNRHGITETWFCSEHYDCLFSAIEPAKEEPNALTLSEEERETVVLARAIKNCDTREISKHINLLHNRQD